MRTLALAAALGLAVASAAFAQSNNYSVGTSGVGDEAGLRQVQDDLRQAGFTDVTIMHEAFLVRAKDRQGRSVMMIVNPQSWAATTSTDGFGGSALPLGGTSGLVEGTTGSGGFVAPDSQPAGSCHLLPQAGDRCS